MQEKKALITMEKLQDRLHLMTILLNREVEVLRLGSKIQSQVHNAMSKSQREFFLREQLRTIKEELGEGSGNPDIVRIQERMSKLDLPENVVDVLNKEIERLEMIPQAAADVWLRKLKQGLCINLEAWDGEGDGREVQKGGDASLSAPGRIPDSKFSSAAQSPPTLCDPTDGSTPGFPKVVEGLKFGSCFLTSCVAFSRNTPPSGQVSYFVKRGLVKPLPRELSEC